MTLRHRGGLVVAVLAALVAACGAEPSGISGQLAVSLAPAPTQTLASTPSPSASSSPSASATSASTATAEPAAILIGAGDICRVEYASLAAETAALVQAEPNALVYTLGDNSNDQGTAGQYKSCFEATWGKFKSRIHPVAGNHDQMTDGGAPYYAYFGAAAGPAGKGYYSYDVAANWHIVVLNGTCGQVRCAKGSPQETWFRADLAAHSGKHVLAMWHQPEFSSGGHGTTNTYITWWRDLYAAHAEIVLDGHDHDYERFARQSPDGKADPNGIREFVSGTGGALHSPIVTIRPNSEVRNASTYGVLELTLRQHDYSWRFIPVEKGGFTDSGETATHY